MLDHDDGFDALVAAVTRLCACYAVDETRSAPDQASRSRW